MVGLRAAYVAALFSPQLSPMLLGAASEGLGLAPGRAGLVTTVEFLCQGVAALLVSPFVHRLDRRRIVVATVAVLAVGHAASAAAGSFGLLVATRILVGSTQGLLLGTINAEIARTRDPERTYAACFLGAIVFGAAGFFCMPVVMGWFGAQRGAYGLAALVAAVAWPLVTRFPRSGREVVASGAQGPPRAVLVLLAATVMISWSDGLVWPFAERIGSALGVFPRVLGWLLGAGIMAGLLGSLGARALGARLGYFGPAAFGMAGTALGGLAMTLAGGPQALACATILKNGTVFFLFPYLLALAADADRSGRGASAMTGCLPLGFALGPVVGGGLIERFGFPALGWAGICLAAVAIGLLVVARISAAAGSPSTACSPPR